MNATVSACVVFLLSTCCVVAADELPPEVHSMGVNLACGEFGKTPGVYNKDYTYPDSKQLDYCRQKGLQVIRLPFKWERIQPQLMQPLDATELARLDRVVQLAGSRDLKLLLDMHNYARYQGKLIGTTEVPNQAFADVWKQLASHYRTAETVLAYGIMNEPHGTQGLWHAAAQAAVDAIRSVDRQHAIFACGDGWSGAHSWQKINGDLLLNDPADRLVYEAHQYFDRDNSGSYKRSYDEEGAYPTVGVERLQPFIQWLAKNHARGFIGEFGVPDNDPRWLVVLDNTLVEMQQHQIGGTYWAAGPWWGDYPLSIEPRDGHDRPQMAVLQQFVKSNTSQRNKSWLAAAQAAEAAARKAREADAKLGRRVYDFGVKKESYHYSNEGSQFASGTIQEQGRNVCKVTYKHVGNPAWVGLGLYFGSLKCQDFGAFHLEARSDVPCRLEVKAYDTSGKMFKASYPVETNWKTLAIPFADLKSSGQPYEATKPIQKIEFQPGTSREGNQLYLGAFRMGLLSFSIDR